MGLAASQCRLLFITQRQNDVSAKMQRISNDRLTLARDEDDVYTKYNRMLNATKYEAVDGVDLSYNAMMASGKVLTNANGAVILDTSTYNELSQNGYISNNEESGRLSFGDKTSFVAKMAGLTEQQQNAPSFEEYIQSNASTYPLLAANPTRPTLTSEAKTVDKSQSDVVGSGYGMDNCRSTGDHTSDMDGAKAEAKNGIKSNIKSFVNTIYEKCKTAFNDVSGDLASKIQKAAADAKTTAIAAGQTEIGETHGGQDAGSSMAHNALGYATNYYSTGFFAQYKHANSHYDKQMVANKFFEDFVANLGQSDTSVHFEYTADNSEDIKAWDTQYNAAQTAWKEAVRTTYGMDDAATNRMAKYDRMYDNLNNREFVKKDLDAEAITVGIANGSIIVSGHNSSDLVTEVADEETRNQAKDWYDNETRKIKRKEDKMDMENTKLQTEYSALTNDYNSVKSIIDANVQKSFTYCQNG